MTVTIFVSSATGGLMRTSALPVLKLAETDTDSLALRLCTRTPATITGLYGGDGDVIGEEGEHESHLTGL